MRGSPRTDPVAAASAGPAGPRNWPGPRGILLARAGSTRLNGLQPAGRIRTGRGGGRLIALHAGRRLGVGSGRRRRRERSLLRVARSATSIAGRRRIVRLRSYRHRRKRPALHDRWIVEWKRIIGLGERRKRPIARRISLWWVGLRRRGIVLRQSLAAPQPDQQRSDGTGRAEHHSPTPLDASH